MLPLLLNSSFVSGDQNIIIILSRHPNWVCGVQSSLPWGTLCVLLGRDEMFCACLFSQVDLQCRSNTLVLYVFCLNHHWCEVLKSIVAFVYSQVFARIPQTGESMNDKDVTLWGLRSLRTEWYKAQSLVKCHSLHIATTSSLVRKGKVVPI